MNAQEVIIPGQFPFDLDFDEVEKVEKGLNKKDLSFTTMHY